MTLSKISDDSAPYGLVKFVLGAIETNTYLFWDPATKESVIIDPAAEAPFLLKELAHHRLHLAGIINTHGHADHIAANADLKKATRAPLFIHPADAPLLLDPALNLSAGLGLPVTSPPPDEGLQEARILKVGKLALTVLETPGHTRGSVCLLGEGMLFSGDTLFAGSAGRTDLPGGNTGILGESLKKLRQLPPALALHPGHGPASSLGYEFEHNPFLKSGGWQ